MASDDVVTLTDIHQDDENARRHDKRNVSMIADSLLEVGAARSGVIDEHGRILAGNATWEALAEAGIDRVKVVDASGDEWVVVRRSGLSERQKKRLSYFDNRTAELADWDVEQIATDLAAGLDLDGLFFDNELEELLAGLDGNEPPADPGAQIDKAAELQEKWDTKLGQVWELGEHRLVCGDCTDKAVVEAAMRGERADIVVTDPPYGVAYDPSWRSEALDLAVHGESIEGDKGFEWLSVFEQIPSDILYVWLASSNVARVQLPLEAFGFETRYLIVWNKDLAVFGRGNYHWKHELCLYMVRKGTKTNWQGARDEVTVWDIPTVHSFKRGHNAEEWGLVGHANQKPLECMERPIGNNTSRNQSVLDPFLGSGTTLIACERLARECRAIEIEPKYIAVTLQRWSDLTSREPKLVSG